MSGQRQTSSIAAIATPAGVGGLSVIRISGGEAEQILSRVFYPYGEASPQRQPRTLVLGQVKDPTDGRVLDEALAVFFAAPHSFTTEDVAELHCHGGWQLTTLVLQAVLAAGAQLAHPGEFSLRAFLGGRLDLAQAEALRDLIEANGKRGVYLAQSQLGGSLSRDINALDDQLLTLQAEIAAGVDFPEDVDILSIHDMSLRISAAQSVIADLLRDAEVGKTIRQGITCAICGAANVGKSSLLNAFLQEERAIVTQSPGTTRDVIEEAFQVDGVTVLLADTAGIRDASDEAEVIGIGRSRQKVAEAAVKLLVFEAGRPLLPQEEELLSLYATDKSLLVVNKCDAADGDLLAAQLEELAPGRVFCISARQGRGVEALGKAILSLALDGKEDCSPRINNERHKEALARAAHHLAQAKTVLDDALPADLAAIDLQEAREALGFISGRTATDDLLERIFSTFCLGK